MVNAREWLNDKYPIKQETEMIDLTGLKVNEEDELIINNWPNLVEIKKNNNDIFKVAKVTIINCPKLEKVNINGFRDNKELNLSQVPSLIELKCRLNQLTNLDTSNCLNLQELNCGRNKLTNLDLSNCTNLTGIYCYDNLLRQLDFSSFNSEKLEGLGLENNNFSEQKLSIFSRFVNLQYLYLGNDNKEKISQGITNSFVGSLHSLKNLTKLELLSINNTDIKDGLEYLPTNLEGIKCNWRNGEIYKQLKNCPYKQYGYYDFLAWRTNNLERIQQLTNQDQQTQTQISPKWK